MTNINLLPWHERQIKNQQQFIVVIAISMLIALILSFLIYQYQSNFTEDQIQRNKVIDQSIKDVNQRLQDVKILEDKRIKILAKIKIINLLRKNHVQITTVFEQLPKITPDGVVLSKFDLSEDKVVISGKASHSKDLSNYMSAIEKSSWLEKPTLQHVNIIDRDDYSRQFSIHTRYKINDHKEPEGQPK